MTSIANLVDNFLEGRPAGNILDDDTLIFQAIAAVSFHAGYSQLKAHYDLPVYDPPRPVPAINDNTDVSVSEWSLIRPLFLLYVERENAIQLEASRGFGVDVYGRSTSEIASDILTMESEWATKAFAREITTI